MRYSAAVLRESGMLSPRGEGGMNELELTGRARTHIVDVEHPRCALHYGAAASFLA